MYLVRCFITCFQAEFVTQTNFYQKNPVGFRSLQERRSTRARRNKLQESLEEPRAPLVGPWEPVRPEEALVPAKPVRKGKTCRVPKGSGLELSNSRKYKTTAAERRRRFREKQGIPDDGSSSRVQVEKKKKVRFVLCMLTATLASLPQVTAPIEQYLIREHTAMGRCRQVAPEFRDKAVAEEKERQQKALQVEAEMEKGAGGAQGEEDREEDRRGEGGCGATSQPILVSPWAHSLSVATLVVVSDWRGRHLGCSKIFISLIYHLYSVKMPGQVLG